MQGPDPSLAYRPNLEKNETKEKEDYRNFEVSVQNSPSEDICLILRSFMAKFMGEKHTVIAIMGVLYLCNNTFGHIFKKNST